MVFGCLTLPPKKYQHFTHQLFFLNRYPSLPGIPCEDLCVGPTFRPSEEKAFRGSKKSVSTFRKFNGSLLKSYKGTQKEMIVFQTLFFTG